MELFKASYQTDSTNVLIGYYRAKSKQQLLAYLEVNSKSKGYGFSIEAIDVEVISGTLDYENLSKVELEKLRKRMLALNKLTREEKELLGLS